MGNWGEGGNGGAGSGGSGWGCVLQVLEMASEEMVLLVLWSSIVGCGR